MADSTKITRDSNAELLRLVCMFMIALGHLITKGPYPEILMGGSGINSVGHFVFLFTEGLVIVAVNVFILISGFYGIKFSFKKLLNLYLICAFYGLIDYILQKIQLAEPIGWGLIRSTVLPFFNSPYWFIPCYVALLCFAPVLNKFIQNASKKEYIAALILLTFINVWMGYFEKNTDLNGYGYNFSQMIYIFFIGGAIARFHSIKRTVKYRSICVTTYLISALAYSFTTAFQNIRDASAYNNPFVILGAIALFLFAMSFSFKSKAINWFSASALSIYLIHMMRSSRNILFPWICNVSSGNYSLKDLILFIIIALSITLLCCMFDKIRILIMKPIWAIYNKFEAKLHKVQKNFMGTE